MAISILSIAAAAAALGRADATAVCQSTGAAAPSVTTLVANGATKGWIVSPDCSTRNVSLSTERELEIDASLVAAVASVPSECVSMTLYNPLPRGIDLSRAVTVSELVIGETALDALKSLVAPPGLKTLTISVARSIASIDSAQFPVTLEELSIGVTNAPLPIKSLRQASLPSGLKSMAFVNADIQKLSDVNYPPAIEKIGCSGCPLAEVRGVKWPGTLRELAFQASSFDAFEIRESDLPTFQKLTMFAGAVKFTSCDDATATLVSLPVHSGAGVCVISDERFEQLYGGGRVVASTSAPEPPTKKPVVTTTIPTKRSNSGSSTGSSSSSAENGSIPEPTKVEKTTQAPPEASTNSSASLVGSSASDTNDSDESRNPGRKPSSWTTSGSGSNGIAPTDSASSFKGTVLTVLLVIGGVGVLGIGFIIQRMCCKSTRQGGDEFTANKYSTLESPTAKSENISQEPDWARLQLIADGFHNDPVVLSRRIDHHKVKFGRLIGRGGYGTVYKGSYQGQPVAIKRMLRDAWRNDSALAGFTDEIRLCASLSHPNIVRFVGVTSSSIRDLAIIYEFMPGGDLHSPIHKHPQAAGQSWSEPWTSQYDRSKTRIASDVADALVYLHSLAPPIIHRDLKAKNVLLDRKGNAKLSDFGISREVDVTATMTSEIGTAAWIAPEVLRGDRYDEKADIYSLNVVLVELDRCDHPFAGEPMLGDGDSRSASRSVVQRNTQMILLVSSGKLRPTAKEVFHVLRPETSDLR